MGKAHVNENWAHPDFKVIRGAYIIGGGRQNVTRYFVMPKEHQSFNEICEDDFFWSYFQTSDGQFIPTFGLVKVDKILSGYYQVKEVLRAATKDRGYMPYPVGKVEKDLDIDELMHFVDGFPIWRDESLALGKRLKEKSE